MTTPLNTVLTYNAIDLTPYEIRGAKSGINNAYSTGPVYDGGLYYPPNSVVSANGVLNGTDSTVRSLTGITTASLNPGKDTAVIDNTAYTVIGILSGNSFGLDGTPHSGSWPIAFSLGQRDYVVEPDSANNTFTGHASFVSGSTFVDGTGTSWITDLTSGDFVKADYFQQYYKIDHVVNNTRVALTSSFGGDTSSTTFTAKKWAISQTRVQYSKNDITFDNKTGRWKYDATTASDVTTSLNFSPLVDGIQLAYTKTIVQNAPDLMDIATVQNKTFSRSTQYDAFQFSLPVVPYPEETFSLSINDIHKINKIDYALNYTQMPMYSPPPPPAQRQVANIMFLMGMDSTPSTALTVTGHFSVVDSSGKPITEVFPDSVHLNIAGIDQTVYKDYVLDGNSGSFDIVDSTVNEPIVKYVATDYSEQVNHGFSITLNGVPQKISYPSETTDDVLFQFDFGRLKPAKQDHPGPGDVYEVAYMVEATTQTLSQKINITTSSIQTTFFPIKQGTIFLQKNKIFLDEDIDYAVSYLTGWIYFLDPLVPGDIVDLTYTPLSKQVNDLTYADGTSYCTTLNSRLTVTNSNFQFILVNTVLDVSKINISRIYNETRDAEYSLAGMLVTGKTINLNPTDSTNSLVGLSLTDVVLIDYVFASDTVEYKPVVQNLMQLKQGASFFYFEGIDLTSQIVAGTVVGAKIPDAATQYYFVVDSVSYDVIGTKVSLRSKIPADLSNPKIFIADDTVQFLTVPYTANPIVSGSTTISFPNAYFANKLRTKTLLKVKNDIYQILSATYDPVSKTTTAVITSEAITDYVNVSDLSSILFSDTPVYNAGDTEIIPANPVITMVKQPVFIMNNKGSRILQVSTDASNLFVDGTAFQYSLNPYISDMSNALRLAHIDGLSLTTYVPHWRSNKIVLGQSTAAYTNSNTLLNALDALRYRYDSTGIFTDSTSFSFSNSGTVLLTNPLVRLDRYELDYMGREYQYDNQVKYSLRYFVSLPAKSKVSASFQYNNLDQFYVQVLDRRDFFETVSIPRMTNEAIQLNGNVGQGGQVAGDSNSQPPDGGIAGDEYRRKDAEIECRVFKDIYDFFEYRLEALGTEMDFATGIKLFNNDGYFTNAQQDAAYKSINRIFPFFDYTNMEPVKVNPLTGYFFDSRVVFHKDRNDVYSLGGKTRWNNSDGTGQLNSGDFIGRTDSTRLYKITQVLSDSSLILDSTFEEHTTFLRRGDKYTAGTSYPLYDDDGYLGPKFIGTESEDFGLFGGNPTPNPSIPPTIIFTGGDVFDVYLNVGHTNQVYLSYTFADPPITPTSPLSFSLFAPSVSEYSASQIAGLLTANIPGLLATAEIVIDGSQPFGYRTAIVLRTTDSYNNVFLGSGAAVEKLGFVPGGYTYGNRDRVDHYPEVMADSSEIKDLKKELTNDIGPLLANSFKIDRVITDMPLVTDLLTNLIPDSSRVIRDKEIPLIDVQIAFQSVVLSETTPPLLPAYLPTQLAQTLAYGADASARAAGLYDSSILAPNYEGKGFDWAWAIDFTEHNQIVHGVSPSGIAVPTIHPGDTTIAGFASFILKHPDSSYDLRILNTALLPVPGQPIVIYQNNNQPVPGTWTGMETDPPVNSNYSLKNDATFTIDPVGVMLITPDPGFTIPVSQATPTALNINWSSATPFQSLSFPYGFYPTVANLISAINSVPGFMATPTIYDTNYAYADLTTSGVFPALVSSGPGSVAFGMYYSRFDRTATYIADTSAIALTINKDTTFISKNEFIYTLYPTLGALKIGVLGVPDMNVTSYFDTAYVYVALDSASGTVSRFSPGTPVHLPVAPLFNVDFDMHNLTYKTDATALNIDWVTGSNPFGRTYVYGTQVVGDIINSIVNQLPSLYAIGLGYDSDYAASFIIDTGSLGATLYRGLRDCTVAYQTTTDRFLDNRRDADTTRIKYLTDRTDYLNLVREPQIKSHVVTEKILRNEDGSPSDLYVWANNRFHRRQGCYSRLIQIQQQMASNQSALSVTKGLT